MKFTRRQTLTSLATLALPSLLPIWASVGNIPPLKAPLRVGIIGHTGRGDYGHGLDSVWLEIPDAEIVGISDPNVEGRTKNLAKLHALAKTHQKPFAPKEYDDFRLMLEECRPDCVSICPRHSDQHLAMLLAAIRMGAHVYVEKPLVVSMEEADQILAAIQKSPNPDLKIAVAHQMPHHPDVKKLVAEFQRGEEGRFGKLVEMNAWGKQDQRAGGEDLMVLGSHLFELMQRFAGPARWCHASVLQDGRHVTVEDRRLTRDHVGHLAGNQVKALYGFDHQVLGTFTSHHSMLSSAGHWGIELIGTRADARIVADIPPTVSWKPHHPWKNGHREGTWTPWASSENPQKESMQSLNRAAVIDLLEAVRENRSPLVNIQHGASAVELALAAHASSLQGARVEIPLASRQHPYAS